MNKADFTLHSRDIEKNKELILSHKKLPGHVIKIGLNPDAPQKTISRVIYADKINSILSSDKKFSSIEKITKKLYRLPGKDEDLLDRNYVVLAPQITGSSYTKLTTSKQSADEIISVIWKVLLGREVSYPNERVAFNEFDISPHRIVITPEGKAVFLNTCIKNHKRRQRWFDSLFCWAPDQNKPDFFGIALLERYAPSTKA